MKVWTYGCSFTAGINELFYSDKAWPALLGYEYENRGHAGGGFYDIRDSLLRDVGNFKEDDLVIVQLTFSNRVVIPYFVEDWDSYMRIYHREDRLEDDIGWLKYLKEHKELDETLEKEASVIFDMLTRLNVRWLWWSVIEQSKDWSKRYNNKHLYLENYSNEMEWIQNNKEYWYSKDDSHQNELGHRVLAKSFRQQIDHYLQYGRTR